MMILLIVKNNYDKIKYLYIFLHIHTNSVFPFSSRQLHFYRSKSRLRRLSESIRKDTSKSNLLIGQGDAIVGERNVL